MFRPSHRPDLHLACNGESLETRISNRHSFEGHPWKSKLTGSCCSSKRINSRRRVELVFGSISEVGTEFSPVFPSQECRPQWTFRLCLCRVSDSIFSCTSARGGGMPSGAQHQFCRGWPGRSSLSDALSYWMSALWQCSRRSCISSFLSAST